MPHAGAHLPSLENFADSEHPDRLETMEFASNDSIIRAELLRQVRDLEVRRPVTQHEEIEALRSIRHASGGQRINELIWNPCEAVLVLRT